MTARPIEPPADDPIRPPAFITGCWDQHHDYVQPACAPWSAGGARYALDLVGTSVYRLTRTRRRETTVAWAQAQDLANVELEAARVGRGPGRSGRWDAARRAILAGLLERLSPDDPIGRLHRFVTGVGRCTSCYSTLSAIARGAHHGRRTGGWRGLGPVDLDWSHEAGGDHGSMYRQARRGGRLLLAVGHNYDAPGLLPRGLDHPDVARLVWWRAANGVSWYCPRSATAMLVTGPLLSLAEVAGDLGLVRVAGGGA